jgi:hypothetical protein
MNAALQFRHGARVELVQTEATEPAFATGPRRAPMRKPGPANVYAIVTSGDR